jgi:hypothetical protein
VTEALRQLRDMIEARILTAVRPCGNLPLKDVGLVLGLADTAGALAWHTGGTGG